MKNLWVGNRRTLGRKLREAVLAVLVEARFKKERVLEAYLNEIYWGSAGNANLHGIGAAARAYFGKDPAELTLAEAATLAGMIQSPASYSPLTAARRRTTAPRLGAGPDGVAPDGDARGRRRREGRAACSSPATGGRPPRALVRRGDGKRGA